MKITLGKGPKITLGAKKSIKVKKPIMVPPPTKGLLAKKSGKKV